METTDVEFLLQEVVVQVLVPPFFSLYRTLLKHDGASEFGLKSLIIEVLAKEVFELIEIFFNCLFNIDLNRRLRYPLERDVKGHELLHVLQRADKSVFIVTTAVLS